MADAEVEIYSIELLGWQAREQYLHQALDEVSLAVTGRASGHDDRRLVHVSNSRQLVDDSIDGAPHGIGLPENMLVQMLSQFVAQASLILPTQWQRAHCRVRGRRQMDVWSLLVPCQCRALQLGSVASFFQSCSRIFLAALERTLGIGT